MFIKEKLSYLLSWWTQTILAFNSGDFAVNGNANLSVNQKLNNIFPRTFLYTFRKESPEAVTGGVLLEKVFLGILQNSQEKYLCHSLFFTKACNFMKKETLAQAFSCEFCDICNNIFFTEDLRATVSNMVLNMAQIVLKQFNIFFYSSLLFQGLVKSLTWWLHEPTWPGWNPVLFSRDPGSRNFS